MDTQNQWALDIFVGICLLSLQEFDVIWALHDGPVVISKIFVHVYPNKLKKNDPVWLTVQPPNTRMTMENPTIQVDVFPIKHGDFQLAMLIFGGCIFFTKGCLNYQLDISGFGHQVGLISIKSNFFVGRPRTTSRSKSWICLVGDCFTDCTMVNHHLNPSKQANQRNSIASLMSKGIVDGRNPANQLRLVVYPRVDTSQVVSRISSNSSIDITGSSGSLI